jgi:subtilisin family serine protease
VKRILVAMTIALALGATPVVADDNAPLPVAHDVSADTQDWQQPAATVDAEPADIVARSADRGEMTVVYAVQSGESLHVVTERVDSAQEAIAAVEQVQDDPQVLAVDVDSPRRLTGRPPAGRSPEIRARTAGVPAAAVTSADPSRTQQWALDRLEAETAWLSSTGAGVTVAVIDSGVARHPDLAGRFVKGKDFVAGTEGRTDPNGHGTHVAGIIAMTANNNLGGAGLAPDVAIMPVVVADAQGSVRASDSAKGIIWAVDHGADVVNMSYSGSISSVEQKAIQYAQSKGVVTVAAAGNAYLDERGGLYNPVQYPAAFPGVLGVGAVNKSLRRSAFSEVGKQVDVVAPGGSGQFNSPRGIFSTYGASGYVRMPGTSMAAPYVSATVALTIAHGRTQTLKTDPVDVLLSSTVDLGAPGRDDEFGFGLVSPVRALSMMDNVQTTGIALPVIAPSEVTSRTTKRVRVKIRKGYVKYRIPAKGKFLVAWQSYKNRQWSELTKFRGKRQGRMWYTVNTVGGLDVRIVAARAKKKPKPVDPIWISPTFRTRSASSR